MAHLQASLRSHLARGCGDLTSLLRSVNALFFSSTAPEHFATLFFGCYDDATRRLCYVNCGQVPPFLLRADGSCERLASTAPALGLMEGWEGTARELTLAAGDTLLLCSDGVTEATRGRSEDADGALRSEASPGPDDDFGEERLEAALRAGSRLPLGGLLESLVDAVAAFAGSRPEDDQTLVAARGL
jgi:sigma-B regulation protein RsbU (phosphoserine phosphatase)